MDPLLSLSPKNIPDICMVWQDAPFVMQPRIVDGGLATGLEELGHELHPRLWSAGVFLEAPQSVEELHAAYLAAGAEILVTASYQMSFEGLAREGLDPAAAESAMRATVETARRAARRHAKPTIVAASVGPYGAVLNDGSEYRGQYDLDAGELAAFHRRRLEVLRRSGADLLAIETIPCLEEARVLCALLSEQDGIDAWISFSCRDGKHIADGHGIQQAAALLETCPAVSAVGVNCTDPEYVAELMDGIREGSGKPIIVYPNSGETWDAVRRRWSGDAAPERFVELAREWARRGAWAIGGCCRVGPPVIRELARAFHGPSA